MQFVNFVVECTEFNDDMSKVHDSCRAQFLTPTLAQVCVYMNLRAESNIDLYSVNIHIIS